MDTKCIWLVKYLEDFSNGRFRQPMSRVGSLALLGSELLVLVLSLLMVMG